MLPNSAVGPGKPGQSGNPAGRPMGARHRTTVLLEKLMCDDAETIVRTVITAASTGDLTAARMVMDRLVPPAKERPLSVNLPELNKIADLGKAHAAIVAAVAAGEMLPSEGQAMTVLLESHLRIVELADLERRLSEFEARG